MFPVTGKRCGVNLNKLFDYSPQRGMLFSQPITWVPGSGALLGWIQKSVLEVEEAAFLHMFYDWEEWQRQCLICLLPSAIILHFQRQKLLTKRWVLHYNAPLYLQNILLVPVVKCYQLRRPNYNHFTIFTCSRNENLSDFFEYIQLQ